MSENAPRTPTAMSSTRVGSYRLLTKIGEGGMGVVHLAEGPDGRRVALKVLRPHIVGDDEARERLAREVSSLRRVKSPRVAEVIDADPWGDTPFVATRYVPGLSLHEHLKRDGVIAGDDLRWFAAGLAEAVIAVHSVGVLHRDIKPSNVLLEGRAPVLIDFGLARLADDPRLTATGWLLGTPGYLAPEILYGDDATTASDVHSWAASVVFAATGRPPFGTGPAMAIMDRVRRGEHDLTGVPADLMPILRAGLSPDPIDRPETAAVLADLRAPGGGSNRSANISTMPLSLVAADDKPAPTRPLTAPMPQPVPAAAMPQPARSPYMTPAPPQRYHPPPPAPAIRPSQAQGVARLQRGALLAGLFALVTVALALAPYLSLAALALITLLIRTWSWTAAGSRARTTRRGSRRWYDAPVAVGTSPWYLVVATGGTLLLLLGAALLSFATGFTYLLFGLPAVPGLLLMGAVFGLSLWWGPGSRRLRSPVRRTVAAATRRAPVGWACVAVLAVLVLVCAGLLAVTGVNWAPKPGPPWRAGTMLGDIVGFF